MRETEGWEGPQEPGVLQNATNHSERTVIIDMEELSSHDDHTLKPEISWVHVPVEADDNDSVVSELDTPELENSSGPISQKEDDAETPTEGGVVPTEKRKNKSSSHHKTDNKESNKKTKKHSKKKKQTAALGPLPDNSRLLRPTESICSHKRGEGTADPHNNAKHKSKKEKVDVDEARRRAKERVRAHKQKVKRQKEQEQERRRSKSVPRRFRVSAEDGRSRAQARVRLRELQAKAVIASKSKLNSPDSGVKTAATKMTMGVDDADDHTVHTCTMDFIMRELSMDAASCREYLLADDSSIASSMSSKRSATVPKAPKFLLEEKYGDKAADRRAAALRRIDQNDDARSISSFSTISTKRSVTTPQSPKFLLDKKYGQRRASTGKTNSSTSLAESSQGFPSSLRTYNDEKSTAKNGTIKPKPTKAEAPKFNASHKRKAEKSSEERDRQEMNNQFRARPMPMFSKARNSVAQALRLGRVAPSE